MALHVTPWLSCLGTEWGINDYCNIIRTCYCCQTGTLNWAAIDFHFQCAMEKAKRHTTLFLYMTRVHSNEYSNTRIIHKQYSVYTCTYEPWCTHLQLTLQLKHLQSISFLPLTTPLPVSNKTCIYNNAYAFTSVESSSLVYLTLTYARTVCMQVQYNIVHTATAWKV